MTLTIFELGGFLIELTEPYQTLVPASVLGNTPGVPEWGLRISKQIRTIVESESFPCLFARKAMEHQAPYYCFVESISSTEGREKVRGALLHYLRLVGERTAGKSTLVPLLVVVKPCYPFHTLDEYRDLAWGLFQYLHDRDAEPWPSNVPTDPERGDWSFCFAAQQLFSNVSSSEEEKPEPR